MDLTRAREMASILTGAGKSRVVLDSNKLKDIEKAITREDVRGLIASKAITIKPEQGLSRGRARTAHARKKAGRYRSKGSRKGTAGARTPHKVAWMQKVRALRKALKQHKEKKEVTREQYRDCYGKVKGNWFRNKKHLEQYVQEISKK